MKVAWIFPHHKKCGISMYASNYCHALSNVIEIATIDCDFAINNKKQTIDIFNTCDCIHLQYETSFYNKPQTLKKLCSLTQKPIVVTLHEVYDVFPGVFPRSQITGTGIIRTIKELVYDRRHPLQKLFLDHCTAQFFADMIIVHAEYQKAILITKGIDAHRIAVVPMPVESIAQIDFPVIQTDHLNLCSVGFINQNYDYTLLFDSLQKLIRPWHFTWIGGVRRKEDNHLLQSIEAEITSRNLQDHITITGWVSDEERNRLIAQSSVCLALFSARSTSLSIATALGAKRYIVATDLPYAREVSHSNTILSIVPFNSDAVAHEIEALVDDTSRRQTMQQAISTYASNHSYTAMANKTVERYREITT